MNEIDLQNVYNYQIYPRGSVINTDKGFVKIDNGSMNGTDWTCCYIKQNKTFYFASFGGQHDNFLLNHLPKPLTFHNFKSHDTKMS